MFKRLKDRIVEEANKLPGGQNSTPTKLLESEHKAAGNSSEDLITLSDTHPVVAPVTSYQQFSIGDDDGSPSEQSTPQKRLGDMSTNSELYYTPNATKEQRSTNTSDMNVFQEYHPSKTPSYVPQSDIESEREDPPTLNLDGISENQLFQIIQKLKARLQNYKNKYSEVTKSYKILNEEKLKIENTLIENQDKGLRRIAELREQCQLEQKAKAHLEENLRLMLEEKDSRISVLETQINLLKSGSELSENCDINSSVDGSSDANSVESKTLRSKLQEKVERFEHVLSQSKNTIIAQKEQITLLRKQNEGLSQELEGKVKMLNDLEDRQVHLKSDHEAVLSTMQSRLEELEKQQEESVMSMAETKKNMHEELELKEKQLVKAEEEARQHQAAFEHEKAVVTELRKQHEERIAELQNQLTSTEKTLEDEKKNLMQELTRGKTAAINLMQQELSKKISATEEEWRSKMSILQSQYESSDFSKVDDVSNKLLQAEDQIKTMQLKMEESNSAISDLKSQNLILKNTIESLKEEAVVSCSNFEKEQVSYTEIMKEKETRIRNLELLQIELKDNTEKFKIIENDLKLSLKNVEFKSDTEFKQKELAVKKLESDKCELNKQLHDLKNAENQLQSECSSSKTEITILSNELQNLRSQLVDMEQTNSQNYAKYEEVIEIQKCLEMALIEKQSITEKFDESCRKVENYTKQNNKLISKNKSLLKKNKDFQNKLNNQEHQLLEANITLHQANEHINEVLKSLNSKQNIIKDYECRCSHSEQVLLSLENERNSMKSSISEMEALCDHLQEKLSSVEAQWERQIVNSSKSSVNLHIGENIKTCNRLPDVIDLTSADKKFSDDILNIDKIMNTSRQDSEITLDKFRAENEHLKRTIDSMRHESENQNIDLIKEITRMQESLSDLQEERNMLSLILENIEKDRNLQNNDTKSSDKPVKQEKGEEKADQQLQNRESSLPHNLLTEKDKSDYVNQISVLNAKVKNEIDFLSAQTEHINSELKTVRDQFENSQVECVEKIAQLNSKLVHRTELLLCVKQELEDTSKHSADMQILCDELQQQIKEANESLTANRNESENKLKSLQESYIMKECELKEMQNSQLSELKDQTEITINKLNETIKQKEDNYKAELCNMRQTYVEEISRYKEQIQEACKYQLELKKINDSYEIHQNQMEQNLNRLDEFKAKIDCMNFNLSNAKIKMRDKNESLTKKNLDFQSSKNLEVDRLNGMLKESQHVIEEQNKLQKNVESIQLQLDGALSSVENLNITLSEEKKKYDLAQCDVSHWKSKYEKAMNEMKEIFYIETGFAEDEIDAKVVLKSDMNKNSSSAKERIELDILEQCKMRFRATLHTLEVTNKALQKEEEKLLAAKNDISHLKLKCDEQCDLMSEAARVSKEYILKDNTLKKANQRISNLLADIKTLQAEAIKMQTELNESKSKVHALKDMTNVLENTLEITSNELNQANGELDHFKSTSSEREKLLNSANLRIEQLSKDIDKLHKEVKTLNESKSEFLILKDSTKDLQNTIEITLCELRQSNSDLDHFKDECSNKNRLLEDANLKINQLSNALEITSNELKQTNTELEQLKIEYLIKEKLLEDTNLKIDQISADLEKSISEVASLSQIESEYIKLKGIADDLQNIVDVTSNELERATADSEQLKSEHAKCEMSLTKTNLEISKLSTELEKSTVEVEQLKHCKSQFNELQNASNILQKKLDGAANELKEVTKLLQDETEKRNMVENNLLGSESKFKEYVHKTESEVEIYKIDCTKKEKDLKESLKKCEDISAELRDAHSHIDELTLRLTKEKEQYNNALKQVVQSDADKNCVVVQLQNNIELHLSSLLEKDDHIEHLKETFDQEKQALMLQKDGSLKCAEDKFQQIEANYITQLEELRLRVQQLEKEKTSLEKEHSDKLKAIQSKFEAKIKDSENRLLKELRTKEEELKVCREKYETCNKEISVFQESSKDKENMIVKLRANLASLSKDHMDKVDELNRRIKQLEQEQEQLMLQAQERVSATEAKCREQLQEKCNQLVLESKEIERLKTEVGLLNNQLDESLLVGEANRTSASQEISLLKSQLTEARDNLIQLQKCESAKEIELSNRIENLEKENNNLRVDCNQVQRLKLEKDQLNETLKSVETRLEEVENLKGKAEEAKAEISCLKDQLEALQELEAEKDQLLSKVTLLEQSERDLRQTIGTMEAAKSAESELLSEKLESLKRENESLRQKVSMLEQCDATDPHNSALKKYVSTVKKECDMKEKLKEEEMEEKNENVEEKLRKEQQIELSSLRQDLFEKDCAIEEMQEHYVNIIKGKEDKIKEYESTIKTFSQNSSKALSDSTHLTAEGSDWDDTWAMPEESCENASPAHSPNECEVHVKQISSMQEELVKCNSEIKELKVLLRLSPPQSLVANNNHSSSTHLLPEPTELEYLKNIIYEYMMGKEPVTLAKVIAAVLRFSDVQTQQVIKKEESKHSTK